MRTRTVAAAAAVALLAAAEVSAQWDAYRWDSGSWVPRRDSNAPSRRGPIRHPSYRGVRGPIQHRRAVTRGPVTRGPLTPRGPVGQRGPSGEWAQPYGSRSADYRYYDYAISDGARRYTHTPGIKE
ncbi:MAG: hypothetical protein IT574_04585 [Candidatus Aureabacteria bacterium]|nr:hypothetical protein [Candidatus Auribacterota bacterium]NLW94865.1 hypothetical protein [Chlamydiota bacterium]HOE27107.1 hypothetical protein [bacterium]HQM52053.1 hypothetical protein [bacterium]